MTVLPDSFSCVHRDLCPFTLGRATLVSAVHLDLLCSVAGRAVTKLARGVTKSSPVGCPWRSPLAARHSRISCGRASRQLSELTPAACHPGLPLDAPGARSWRSPLAARHSRISCGRASRQLSELTPHATRQVLHVSSLCSHISCLSVAFAVQTERSVSCLCLRSALCAMRLTLSALYSTFQCSALVSGARPSTLQPFKYPSKKILLIKSPFCSDTCRKRAHKKYLKQ